VVSAPEPAAPAFDAEAATREIRTALDRFAAAFETRRIDEVRRIAPGMSTEFAKRWQTLLEERSVSDLRASVIRVSPPEFDGGVADVFFAMRLSYRINGQAQSPEIQYSAKMRRDGSAWRITSVSGR
jgi:hypothetical protein